MSDVKLCVVCDSAVGANVFVTLAMQVIQPMVMRLQDKHSGCKLTVGMVTYTTPTTRPAIVARRAFTQATALFPLFRTAPHSLGIGTSGSGGLVGMAVLEGLVAAIEMCDDVLEASARRQRTRHPGIPSHPPRQPPIFHVLLIGGHRIDFARRPTCNQSALLDEITWETLPDELSKRGINLSLCLNGQIKELLAVHNKLWPSPDPVWFPKPKPYTILLSGTHMVNAKRQLEAGPSDTVAPKRPKESPKPTPRPGPGKIDIPTPQFSPPKPQAAVPQAAPQPPAPQPPAPQPPAPQPPAPQQSVPQPPSLPAQPTPPTGPTQAQASANHQMLLKTYQQLHNVMLADPAQRAKFVQAGFRIDESGALIGAAGVVLDSKGQPGIGATIPPKMHSVAWERIKQNALAANAAGGAGARANNPTAITQQQLMVAQMRNMMQQHQAGQAPGGQVPPVPGSAQLPVSQSDPISNQNHASPLQAHGSPSHTHTQPEATHSQAQQTAAGVPTGFQQPGGVGVPIPPATFPPNAPSSAQLGAVAGAGTTLHHSPGIPSTAQQGATQASQQQPGPIPVAPQQASATAHHHVGGATPQFASTPQHASTPQNVVGTPQQIGVTPPHGTPQLAHATPQLAHATPQALHSTPKFAHATPQMSHPIPQAVPGAAGATPQAHQQSPPGAQYPAGVQNPGVPGPSAATPQNSAPGAKPAGAAPAAASVWRGQIAYLLQQRLDQEPAPLHFSVIAAGGPNQNIETHRWPGRLSVTSGFKALPPEMATQLYSSQVPFGQISIDPSHANTDVQKWQVFQKIITAGWCIFYEFQADPANPTHNPTQGAHGVLFFSTSQAPGRILFKAFVNQLCPASFIRGGQPAGPKLTRTPNPPANGTNPNPAPPNPAPVTGAGANLGMGTTMGLPGAGPTGPMPGAVPVAPAAAVAGMPSTMPSTIPGAGMVPGAGAGMGARPHPTPTPPNPNPTPPTAPTPNPGGMNPALMHGLNPANAMAAGMSGINPAAVSGLGAAGMPGLNPGVVPGLNPAAMNPVQAQAYRTMNQMALARLGITPAQLSAASPAQKQMILAQVQQMMLRLRATQQQGITVPGAGPAVGMQQRPPAMGGGQPSLEHIQAYIRQQQQQQQQQQQR